MRFPESVTVGPGLVLRKTDEETTDEGVWLTYTLENNPSIQIDLQIDPDAFDGSDLKSLETALAEDLAEQLAAVAGSPQTRGPRPN